MAVSTARHHFKPINARYEADLVRYNSNRSLYKYITAREESNIFLVIVKGIRVGPYKSLDDAVAARDKAVCSGS